MDVAREHKLIFSDEPKFRISRHLLFWLFWYLYIGITHAANPFASSEISYFRNPVYTSAESFFIVLAQVPMTYIMLYFVLPKFILKRKYILAFVSVVIIWVLTGMINIHMMMELFPKMLRWVLPEEYIPKLPRTESASFFMAIIATNKGAFTMTSLALMIRFVKHWYLKEQRNLKLQKENAETQLKLLTAQIHPHFLFNTLNNIFSQTQTESPNGSKMIMGLSDMLRYILYEGQKPLVPLEKELLMIKEYISLERVRYGNNLDVHMLVPDKLDDIQIAPLLLLPLVENCFKHGTSNFLEKPWINLTVELEGSALVMKLMNGKAPSNTPGKNNSGIGIRNVQQRLSLLYNDKFDLHIRDEEEVFVVDLRVELVRIVGRVRIDSFAGERAV